MLQARGAERIACGEERAMALLIVEGCTSWGGLTKGAIKYGTLSFPNTHTARVRQLAEDREAEQPRWKP